MRLHLVGTHKQPLPSPPQTQIPFATISYFFLSFVAAFPFAVPLTVLARFLRCLPNHTQPKSAQILPNMDQSPTLSKAKEMHIHTLLSARLLNLRSSPVPHQPIMRLKFLHHLMAIIDKCEPGALAASVLCSEAEAGDLVLIGLVELGEL